MATTTGQVNYQRGVASLVILSLLKREDMYGYQLVQEMERQSGGSLSTQEGSLYPVLYKLLEQGFISDRKVLVGKRMNRIYYHLEPAGADYLKLFPAVLGPGYVKDLKAVVKKPIFAVGGVNVGNIAQFLKVCAGVGIGSAVYKAGFSAETVV